MIFENLFKSLNFFLQKIAYLIEKYDFYQNESLELQYNTSNCNKTQKYFFTVISRHFRAKKM